MTRKFTFLLMALLALAGFKSWGQETLTVCDGMDFNTQVPIYTGYFDVVGTTSQFIIPSTEIAGLQGGSITKLEFYIAGSPTFSSFDYAELKCSLKEVDSEVINGIVTSGLSTVYEGLLTYTATTMSVTFTTPFTYTGGHLLVSFEVTSKSGYNECYFYGTNTSYVSSYCNQWVNTPISFIPKTTITYTGGSSCIAPTGLAASNVTATSATISWTGNDAESYDLAYGVASTFDLSNPSTYTLQNNLTTTSVQLSGLTTEAEYKCAVRSHCNAEEVSAWSSAVSFLPTAKMTLTVNEGNTYNEFVPFYGYYADNLTKSQFIIPATTLSAMEGADITAMEFYTTTSGSNNGPANYTFGGSWDVYFKIVDHVEMPSSYEPLEGMDKVYTGNMVIANNKMTLTFAEPYTYEGGNLMICFNQTASTGYKHTYWKGVTTGPTAAYAGYGSNNYNHGNYYFLPTTTFTYTPGATRYNVTVDNAITGGSISANPTEATAGTVVSLSATPAFGYEFGAWVEDYEDVTIEDNQFTMPEHDVTISATFNELTQYAISCAELAEGTIHAEYEGETITQAPAGTEVILVAEPNAGYVLDHFVVDDEPLTGNTFEMPSAAVNVSAVFSVVYSVTVDPQLVGGTIAYTDLTSATAFAAGTTVFLTPQAYTDYVFVDNSIVATRTDNSETVAVNYNPNMGAYYIEMPASNVTVTATFNAIPYFNVTKDVTPMYSGYYDVSKTSHIAENEQIAISNINPATGYEFGSVVVTRDDNGNAVETSLYQGSYYFDMPNSDVTVTVTFNALPRYSVSVGEVVNGTITVDEPFENILAGTPVYFSATPATDYVLESLSVKCDNEDQTDVEYYDWYGAYRFYMPSSNVTISATFRQLQTYTINYYVNGELDRTMQCREDGLVNNDGPQNVAVPAGMTFEGWGVAEIGTYVTEKPAVLGNAERPTQNYDLYAVLSYSESVPAGSKDGETWVEVTSPTDLSNGDQVIFVEKNNNKVLTARTGEYDGCFRSADVTISSNEINSIPSNAVVFEADNTSGSWKFWFEDAFRTGLTTLTDCNGGYLVPVNMNWGGSDLWTIISNGSSVNIIGASNQPIVYKSGDFTTESSSLYKRSALFKKYNPVITTNYYMTSVLTNGEVTENTTAKNIIISNYNSINVKDGATLTMDANGLFRNGNEFNGFVFEDGTQFYYTGEESVNAIFKKEINGYTGENDNYYLIANPTDNNYVGNLDYYYTHDLYTFDPEEALEWQNHHDDIIPYVERGIGYLYANSEDITLQFFGNLMPAGTTALTLVKAEEGEGIDFPGFNLIGNPFACNAYVSGYNFYTMENGEFILNEGSATVAPCEGFFVEATATGQSVTLSTTAPEAPASMMSLTVSNESNVGTIDRAIVRFDGANDLHKFMLNPDRTNICLAKNGEEFAAVSTSSTSGEIPISFKAERNGSYTINVDTENVNAQYIHLIDNKTGMDVDLLATPSYTFNASTSDYAYRFKLVFNVEIGEANGNNGDSNNFAYMSNGNLVIEGIEGEATMQIVDVLGRVVSTEIVNGSYNKALNLKAGLYIINLNGMTQKIVVE